MSTLAKTNEITPKNAKKQQLKEKSQLKRVLAPLPPVSYATERVARTPLS